MIERETTKRVRELHEEALAEVENVAPLARATVFRLLDEALAEVANLDENAHALSKIADDCNDD